MARCCAVCGKPLSPYGHYVITVELWDNTVESFEQCCFTADDFDRTRAYAVPFETPDPDAVRMIDVRMVSGHQFDVP